MLHLIRWGMFFGGLCLLGMGNALAVKVKFLGLHPWEVLNVALFQQMGLTIGSWSIITGLFLVLITYIVDRKYISLGTFLNAMCVGVIMDFFLWSGLLPESSGTWTDYFILLTGILLAGIGGGLYVASNLGAGPRDGFMLIVSERTGISVSRARILVESIILIFGFLLGGPVFIATFIYTFIQSPVFQKSRMVFSGLLGKWVERRSVTSVIQK